MEVNIVELVVQAGALGLMALLLFGLWKWGGGLVARLMDNNDASIRVQMEMANNLEQLTTRIVDSDEGRDKRNSKRTDDSARAQAELVEVLKQLSSQIDAHEERAQARHKQQLNVSRQICNVLKGMKV